MCESRPSILTSGAKRVRFAPTHYFTLPTRVIDPLQLRSNGCPDRPSSPGRAKMRAFPVAVAGLAGSWRR